jgi:biotin carboxyl carrier protein
MACSYILPLEDTGKIWLFYYRLFLLYIYSLLPFLSSIFLDSSSCPAKTRYYKGTREMNSLRNSEPIRIMAQMAGTVVEVSPSLMPGMHVRKGEELLTLERMKLFCPVSAPCTGVITAVMTGLGCSVLEGEILFEIEV